jgi:carbon-monoxide dehydrogenase large subunit
MGNSVLRKEDPPLLTGQANFTDDIRLPGMLHFALLRSPHAHARIRSVDVSAAMERPGVVAVFTGEDLAGEWAIGIPTGWPVTEDIKIPDHWPLARGEVNHAGDGVAVVVATDRYRAQDALEYIEVDYEVLPAVVDVEAALEEGSPLVHEDLGTNKCYTWPLGTGDIDKAFDEADVVVSGRYVQQRLIPSAIEPRAVVVNPEPATGNLTVYTSTQVPHFVKDILAIMCGVSDTKLRVVAPDVGGGFGGKLNVYAEEALALALARRLKVPGQVGGGPLGEPRGEHPRPRQVQHIELAARRDGKILGMKVRLLADMGAYLQLLTPGIAIFGSFTYPGLYTFDAYSFECTGVFTNLTPTDAYRGAGRSEAAYAHERIMDDLARELGMDPAELRIKNLIPPFDEPTTTPAGVMYDSGDYETCMRRALELADYDALRAEQRRRRESGDVKQLGIGIGNFTESGGLSPSKVAAGVRLQSGGWEAASVRMFASGKVEVVTGTSPHGQGHETSWSQIAADAFGVDVDDVEVLHGDTAVSPYGRDTYGSRSLAVGGVALSLACGKVIDKAKKIAAHMLEAAEDDIEFEGGRFSVAGSPARTSPSRRSPAPPTSRTTCQTAWSRSEREPLLRPPELHLALRHPRLRCGGGHGDGLGDHPEVRRGGRLRPGREPRHRGRAAPRRHSPGHSPGPLRGGGLRRGGNLITGSMMNYMIPGAPEIPNMILDRTETPSPTNPMGVKGIGESGAIAAQPAVINAVIDALGHLGVTHIDMPPRRGRCGGLSRTPPARTERCNRRPKGKGLRSSRTHHKEET